MPEYRLDWKRPQISPHPYVSNALAMAMNDSRYEHWLADHFIQLVCYVKPSFRLHVQFSETPFYDDCAVTYPMLDVDRISTTSSIVSSLGLSATIERAIRDGCYVYLWCDRYWLPDTMQYHSAHYTHPVLIFGIDTDAGCYYTADHFDEGRYVQKRFRASDVVTACGSAFSEDESDVDAFDHARYKGCLYLVRLRDVSYEFDLCRFRRHIKAFLDSSPAGLDVEYVQRVNVPGGRIAFGKACFPIVQDIILDTSVRYPVIPVHMIYEHQKAMALRLGLLRSALPHIGRELEAIKSDYNRLANHALVSRNLVLKWSLTRTQSVATQAHKNLSEIEEKNDALMHRLLYVTE